jgi:hypothetical protein
MAKEYFVIGTFKYADSAKKALSEIKKMGLSSDAEYYSPFPDHNLEDEKYEGIKRSPVRRFTLLGALTGCFGAFLFTSWMSLDYPIRVSAKPILSYPAFVVIAFECTILLGGIFTLLSMFHFARIPNLKRPIAYRRQFSEDKFGVTIHIEHSQIEKFENLFKSLGAEEVEKQYGV